MHKKLFFLFSSHPIIFLSGPPLDQLYTLFVLSLPVISLHVLLAVLFQFFSAQLVSHLQTPMEQVAYISQLAFNLLSTIPIVTPFKVRVFSSKLCLKLFQFVVLECMFQVIKWITTLSLISQ